MCLPAAVVDGAATSRGWRVVAAEVEVAGVAVDFFFVSPWAAVPPTAVAAAVVVLAALPLAAERSDVAGAGAEMALFEAPPPFPPCFDAAADVDGGGTIILFFFGSK